jgi:hypothetical protein
MKKLAGLFGALLVASCAAQAAIQISYSVNGSAPAVCGFNAVSSGPAICGAVAASPVTISVSSATSNSPGTPDLAQVFESTLFISNTSAATLELWIAAQDFTAPVTPPEIQFSSSLSTTTTTGTGTADLTSCVDTANGLTPPTTAFCAAGYTLTNAQQTYTPPPPPGGSTSGTVSTTLFSLAAPYSLAQHITLALGAGSNINVITSASLTPVPEPMSIALLGGVVLLTSGAIRRKRKQARV